VATGDDWQHAIKCDGFRVQIHKLDDEIELYSRSGSRFGRRFPRLVEVIRELPAKSAIIDGEIWPVAYVGPRGAHQKSRFYWLSGRRLHMGFFVCASRVP
jgi:ATP-dependent DNA ligase